MKGHTWYPGSIRVNFSLDEVGPGMLEKVGGLTQCAAFGGAIKKDTQAVDGKVGVLTRRQSKDVS